VGILPFIEEEEEEELGAWHTEVENARCSGRVDEMRYNGSVFLAESNFATKVN
jgi:hypothetical protein